MAVHQWHSYWGGQGGEECPLDGEKFAKNQEKGGENQEKEEKSGRVYYFAPPDRY